MQKRSTMILAASCVAQLLVTLDVSVVNVALPSIRADLGMSALGQQWIVTAYALPFAGLLLIGGRLADVLGVRAAFMLGTTGFATAGLVAGLAPEPWVVIVGRIVQGCAAAVLAPATLTAITTSFDDGPPRARAMAWWTSVNVAGGAVGNALGGILTEYAGWRSTMLMNVVLGLLALLLAARSLGRVGRVGASVDIVSAGLATVGLVAATYGLGLIGEDRIDRGALAIGIGGALIATFVRRDRRSGAPLMPWSVLANSPTLRRGNIGVLAAGATLVPMWFFLTLQLQGVLHYGPLQAGLALVPHAVIQVVVGLWLTPRLMKRVSARLLIRAGAIAIAAGFAWQSRLGPGEDYVSAVLLPGLIFAAGAGLLNLPLTTAAVAGVPDESAGAVSGIMNCAKQVGGGLGLAALVAGTAGVADRAAAYAIAFLAMAAVMVLLALGPISPRRPPARRCGRG